MGQYMEITQMDSDIAAGGTRDYRIEVQDFGPITRRKVEFRPLTVFLGPSNAGKSYLATLGYALHRHFAAAEVRWFGLGRFFRVRNRGRDARMAPELRSELESWASAVTGEGAFPGLPGRLSRFVNGEIEKADGVAGPLRDEIVRSFGADRIEDLVRHHGSGRAKVAVALSDPVDGGSLAERRDDWTAKNAECPDTVWGASFIGQGDGIAISRLCERHPWCPSSLPSCSTCGMSYGLAMS